MIAVAVLASGNVLAIGAFVCVCVRADVFPFRLRAKICEPVGVRSRPLEGSCRTHQDAASRGLEPLLKRLGGGL